MGAMLEGGQLPRVGQTETVDGSARWGMSVLLVGPCEILLSVGLTIISSGQGQVRSCGDIRGALTFLIDHIVFLPVILQQI